MIDRSPLVRRLFAACALIATVILFGTSGYVLVERWNLVDSFYMTVITIATVGFTEVCPLTPTGKLFTSALIFISVVCLSFWTASLTSLIIEGDLSGFYLRRKAKRMSAYLKNHTIVCGSGIMAQAVVAELTSKHLPVAVIDDDPTTVPHIREKYPHVPLIVAPAIEEMALFDANVLNAKNVVAALASDFDNLLIAMTCKDLGTDVKVVARSNDIRIARRMLKAGVDHVICPFQLSGIHAAQLIAG